MPHRAATPATALTLHVEARGAGPPLLLLHGFTGRRATWAPLAASFAAAAPRIAVDLPGHGRARTRPPIRPATASARLADDLLARCSTPAASSARRARLLAGRARRAAPRARRIPDRVAALVLESASPGIADAAERAARVGGRRGAGRRDRARRRGGVRRPVGGAAALRQPGARCRPRPRARCAPQRLAQQRRSAWPTACAAPGAGASAPLQRPPRRSRAADAADRRRARREVRAPSAGEMAGRACRTRALVVVPERRPRRPPRAPATPFAPARAAHASSRRGGAA